MLLIVECFQTFRPFPPIVEGKSFCDIEAIEVYICVSRRALRMLKRFDVSLH